MKCFPSRSIRFFFALCSCCILLLVACQNQPAAVPAGTADSSGASGGHKEGDTEAVMSILYQQQAAEYRALCLQAYSMARARVLRAMREPTKKDSLAVITDLDETALDNSENEAQLFLDGATYTGSEFLDWGKMKKAGAVPGSIRFFNAVNDLNSRSKKKIDIFYISNRDTSLVQPTMDNMSALGFPQIIRSHFLFCPDQTKPSKEGRRKAVEKNHHVLVLLGDNLIDLDSAFDSGQGLTEGGRRDRVDSLMAYWGDKYIVFPNAIYGDWEGALYHYHYPATLNETWRIRQDSLHGYK